MELLQFVVILSKSELQEKSTAKHKSTKGGELSTFVSSSSNMLVVSPVLVYSYKMWKYDCSLFRPRELAAAYVSVLNNVSVFLFTN